jgi:cell fate regulator YaaT (PSP1 superfamily)
MGCSSCGTGGGCSTGGCNSNGGCSTGGCNKLNVFDWLGNMDDAILPSERFNIIEIRFKGGRKEFFKNTSNLTLHTGDPVVVEVQSGHHLGFVSLQGELVRLQMKKKNIENDAEIKSIYRLANEKDLERYELSKMREMGTLYRTRQIAHDLNLQMKLSDIEYQADNAKATFFYSADDRVDFRELIKTLASEFKIRVEMKQISLRQEASRLGGIGVCGRELCCSTWLTDFKNVSTTAARYQNLSLNPAKLSGQCGRLKCCLNFELETYMDALKGIPTIEAPLLTAKGPSYLQKTDIFRRIMWFSYQGETAWYPLTIDQVLKLVELNEKGIKPDSLDPDDLVEVKAIVEFRPINDDLAQLDKKYSIGGNKSKNKKKPNQTFSRNSSSNSNAPSISNENKGESKPLVPNKSYSNNSNKNNQGNSPQKVGQSNPNQQKHTHSPQKVESTPKEVQKPIANNPIVPRTPSAAPNPAPQRVSPQPRENQKPSNPIAPRTPADTSIVPRQAQPKPEQDKPSAIVPRKSEKGPSNPNNNRNEGGDSAPSSFVPKTPIKPN